MLVIPLNDGLITIVDEEDRSLIENHNWVCYIVKSSGLYYVRSRIKGKVVYLHKLLLPNCNYVDHINGQTLDNRKSNLREASSKENCYNSIVKHNNKTKIKGVCFHSRLKTGKAYQARIRDSSGKRISLGYFNTSEEAGQAYSKAAMKIQGKFYKGDRTYDPYNI